MAEQLEVEDIKKAKDAFLDQGVITKNKFSSIITSLGLTEDTVVNSPKEIFQFKEFTNVFEQLKAETGADEIIEIFIDSGHISKENILSFINSRSNSVRELREDELQVIMGDKKVYKYSYKRFLSILICVHLREMFEKFDTDGNGYMEPHELMNFLESNSGRMYSFHEVTQHLKKVDLNGDGKINFEEFVQMMTDDTNKIQGKMRETFKEFDIDGDGFVSREELKEVLSKVEENFNEDEIDELVEWADQDGDGKINFEEFIEFFDWDN